MIFFGLSSPAEVDFAKVGHWFRFSEWLFRGGM
jgi:hypothetical protein